MASKKWEEAVEELKKKREEILALKEKEAAVISLANATAEFVFYDKPATVKIPKSEIQIGINDKYNTTLAGKEVDIPLFKKLLDAAGFYAEKKSEYEREVTLEVSVKPIDPNTDEDKVTTEEDEQDT